MSFRYTAAALAASSLLVNAAPAPKPSQTTQEPDRTIRPFWDPYNVYGNNYFGGYNPYDSYEANPTPQAEDYWGPNGFDGEAWNNAHRQDPYPSRRSVDNAQSADHFPGGPGGPRGSVFGDDGDDDTTLVLLSPLSFINGILPLPDLGALFGDLFGYQQAPRPAVYGYPPFPKGAYPPFPKGAFPPFPKGAYPPGFPKGFPKAGQPGGPPIVAPLDNGAGSVSIGLNGGSFSLDPIPGATPGSLSPGSPVGNFPKGWPAAGRPTPAPVAPPAGGIVAPLDGGAGSQSIGLNPGTFSLDGSVGGASAPLPTPAPAVVAPAPAGGIVSAGAGAAQSLGLAGASFTLDGTTGAAATPAPVAVPAPPAPAANVAPVPAPANVAGAGADASLGLAGSQVQGIGAAPVAAPSAAAPVASPVAASPVAAASSAASPAAASSAAASPMMAASTLAAAAGATSLGTSSGGSADNGAVGLSGSSATIS